MTYAAEIQNGERSRSFVYFEAADDEAAQRQLDFFLFAQCIDPERVTRFGSDFDPS